MQKYFDLARCPACHNISHSILSSILCAKLSLMWEAVNRKQECINIYDIEPGKWRNLFRPSSNNYVEKTLWVCYYEDNLFATYVKKLESIFRTIG